MATFRYKARTTEGRTVAGVLTADNQQAALRTLDQRALVPLDLAEGGIAQRSLLSREGKKIKTRVLSRFYGQLADLLRAGVPVLRALDVLVRQESEAALTEILREVRDDVAGGASLGDAMEKHPNAFNDLQVSMVRAGERGGFLEDVLSRIATFTERQDELRSKLVGSMIYPCVLMFGGTAVVVFLLMFVVPKIRPFLARQENLPILTQAVFGVCDFLGARGLYLLAGLFLALLVALPYLRSERGRLAWDRFRLRAPLVGRIVKMVAICRFCRILGTMLQNGVPILQALRIGKDSAGSKVLADEIERASENVRKGETLAVPLGDSGLFPIDIVDMIAVAEESNNLEQVLIQIADANEARTSRAIDLAVRLVEPLMLLVMAVVVLVIAAALLVPILTMSASGFK